MSKPTLSIVMSNYNHARFLPQALQSVLDQSYRPDEIILIDDCSTDHSVEVIERFVAREPLIRFIRNERNRGILHNQVKLVEMASGKYLFALACDDMIMPGFLEKSMKLLTEHPEAGICSSFTRVIDKDGRDLGVLPGMAVTRRPGYLSPSEARRTLTTVGNWMQGNTTVYRKEALIRGGGYPPQLHSFADNFASQVLALRHGACFLPEALGCWRRMEGTFSVRCLADADIGQQIIRNATALMRNEYRDLFPRAYVRVWEREAKFEQARHALSFPPPPADAAAIRPPTALATLYLLLKYRPSLTIRRRIKMLLETSAPRLA